MRRAFAAGGAAALVAAMLVAPAPVRAEYPEKEIALLVGVGAGGAADAGARMLGRELEKILGKPVAVANRVGGGGTMALALLAKEAPDGYSLAYAFSHHITFGGQYKRRTPLFRVVDFDYPGSVTEPRQSLVSLAGRGWSSFDEMLKTLKAENQPIRIAYSGGPGRLIAAALQKDLKYPVRAIAVRDGGRSMQRLFGGQVELAFSGGAHAPHTGAGETVVLASVHERRDPDFPAAPTLKELGVNASTTALQLVVAPKGLPRAVAEALSDAIAQAVSRPEVAAQFRKNLNMRTMHLQGQALVDYLLAEERRFARLIDDYDK